MIAVIYQNQRKSLFSYIEMNCPNIQIVMLLQSELKVFPNGKVTRRENVDHLLTLNSIY